MVLSPSGHRPGGPPPQSAPRAQSEPRPEKAGPRRAAVPPLVTIGLIVANVAVMGLMVAQGVHPMSPTSGALAEWGGNIGLYTLGGQWWRLLTACFLHGGLIHLAFNMYVLWDLGRLNERVYGPVGFLVIYLVAGIGGAFASALMHPLTVSVGASGAVFGAAGSFLAFLLRNRGRIEPGAAQALRRSLVSFVVMNLAIGFAVPFIDQAAHIGGLVMGFLAGLLASPVLQREGPRRAYWSYPVVAAVGAAACVLAWLGVMLPH